VNLSPDGRWAAFQAELSHTMRLFVAPLGDTLPITPDHWIPITGPEDFGAGAKWSADGRVLYYTSTRDRSVCLWAIRLNPATKRPEGEPYAVKHFHTNPRANPYMFWPILTVDRERVVINLEQVQGDLWMTKVPEGQ
jgi:hypothetical protein